MRVLHQGHAVDGASTFTTLRVGVPSGASVTASAFQTVSVAGDSTPHAFNLGQRVNVSPNTWIESDVITPSGFDVSLPVRAPSGTQLRIDHGPWHSSIAMIAPGQSLQVRHLSSPHRSTVRSATISIGHATGTFRTYTAGRLASPRRFAR